MLYLSNPNRDIEEKISKSNGCHTCFHVHMGIPVFVDKFDNSSHYKTSDYVVEFRFETQDEESFILVTDIHNHDYQGLWGV